MKSYRTHTLDAFCSVATAFADKLGRLLRLLRNLKLDCKKKNIRTEKEKFVKIVFC